jgi:hypothetical protein
VISNIPHASLPFPIRLPKAVQVQGTVVGVHDTDNRILGRGVQVFWRTNDLLRDVGHMHTDKFTLSHGWFRPRRGCSRAMNR